jgi:hypothetical protein
VQPTAIAWEVWTYLERHRKDTLRCVGSFDAQWKADRFVTEAERSKPDRNLRVHYEVKSIFDGDKISDNVSSNMSDRIEVKEKAVKEKEVKQEAVKEEEEQEAIDVEIWE